MPPSAVTLTFDLSIPKSNQHVYEPTYICHQNWVKFLSLVFTARHSYASAVSGVVILSLRPSVARVLCDKPKQCTANILIPHEREIALTFLTPTVFVVDAPFRLKFALKVTHPLRKTPTSTYLCL